MKLIIKCLKFLSREGRALQGHRDDLTSDEIDDHHLGKFRALLNFRVEAGDAALEQHHTSCKKNATYISKTVPNELLLCMGQFI